jgi:hypothetical protein
MAGGADKRPGSGSSIKQGDGLLHQGVNGHRLRRTGKYILLTGIHFIDYNDVFIRINKSVVCTIHHSCGNNPLYCFYNKEFSRSKSLGVCY